MAKDHNLEIQIDLYKNLCQKSSKYIQGDFESCADILITTYWLHVELGKNI
jgi:hypothetical protein